MDRLICGPCHLAAKKRGKHRAHRCSGSPVVNVTMCQCRCQQFTSAQIEAINRAIVKLGPITWI